MEPEKLQEIERLHAEDKHEKIWEDARSARCAAVDTAKIAIKSLTLVNGGAVIALLAFISAIFSSEISNTSILAITTPLLWFSLGVGLSAATATIAYLVNGLDESIIRSVVLTWSHPYSQETEQTEGLSKRRGLLWNVSIILVLGSLVCFFLGVFSFYSALSQI